MPPAEGRAGGGELLGDGAVVLLGVQGAVLADGVAEQQVEHRPGRAAELAVAIDEGAGAGLVVGLDGGLGLGEQRVGRDVADLLAVLGQGVGLGVQARPPARPCGRRRRSGWRARCDGWLTRAMFRQALAASEAWTPTEAPWTLPFGFAAESSLPRPGSRRTSWLAASEIASPMASGAMPSARAAATASAACSRGEA